MKKIPKPQRARKGGRYIGNHFIKDPDTGKQINLGTKMATLALERAREFATTGKKNFQDDLDGAAEATVAAVEAAPAPAIPPAPVIEQPAAVPLPPPVAAAPAPAPALETPPPPAPAGDWREDAQAAASETVAAADEEADPTVDTDAVAMSAEEMDGLYRTAAELIVEGQLWAQSWIAKKRTGEAPPAFDKLAAMVVQQSPKMGELIIGQRDRGVSMWSKQLKLWVPLEFLPLYAGALISVASLAPLQIAAAASIAAQKKQRAANGGAPPAPPPPAAAAPAANDINGAGAEAL